jgi:hypothetical protein
MILSHVVLTHSAILDAKFKFSRAGDRKGPFGGFGFRSPEGGLFGVVEHNGYGIRGYFVI